MELFLMRHADALDGTGDDFARLLSGKGRAQSNAMGQWLKKIDARLSAIITSPYPRAHETAYIVAHAAGQTKLIADQRLSPGMTMETGCAIVYEFAKPGDALLLVGHAPDLGRLASYLIGANDGSISLRKGGIAQLEVVRAGFGGSDLLRIVDPKAV